MAPHKKPGKAMPRVSMLYGKLDNLALLLPIQFANESQMR